jgi:hypothetical protein
LGHDSCRNFLEQLIPRGCETKKQMFDHLMPE